MICLHGFVRSYGAEIPAGVDVERCWKCEYTRRRWREGPWEPDRSPKNHAVIRAQAERLHGATP